MLSRVGVTTGISLPFFLAYEANKHEVFRKEGSLLWTTCGTIVGTSIAAGGVNISKEAGEDYSLLKKEHKFYSAPRLLSKNVGAGLRFTAGSSVFLIGSGILVITI